MNTWLDRIHHGLLPTVCLVCGAAGTAKLDLCVGCQADLPHNRLACQVCALPLSVGEAGCCTRCRTHLPAYDRVFAPFCYQAPVDFLIRRLKFNGRLSHARLLGELFALALAERGGPWPDCLVPVPLHPRRLRARGFNQALELARPVARSLNLPLLAEALHRVRHTSPQTGLDARARQTNLAGAFMPGQPLSGLRVALFDDVMTTASTVTECARILRAGGATDIEIWVIGRAGGADQGGAGSTLQPASGA